MYFAIYEGQIKSLLFCVLFLFFSRIVSPLGGTTKNV